MLDLTWTMLIKVCHTVKCNLYLSLTALSVSIQNYSFKNDSGDPKNSNCSIDLLKEKYFRFSYHFLVAFKRGRNCVTKREHSGGLVSYRSPESSLEMRK